MQEVVVTGIGVLASLGNEINAIFDRVLAGTCGITCVGDDQRGLGDHLEARVPDHYIDQLSGHESSGMDRSVAFSMNAARSAWKMAGQPEVNTPDLAVSISAGLGGLTSIRATLDKQRQQHQNTVRASTVPRVMPNAVAAKVAIDLGAQAGTYSPVSACASGLEAIALAHGLIASGQAEVVVAGGSEAVLDPLTVMGFGALRALSTNTTDPAAASRPFDRERDGFVLAEGAGVLVLESMTHARRRSAQVLCHVEGAGITSDGHHLVAPEPTGLMAAAAMSKALKMARRTGADLSGVYAHATGTIAGDAAEAYAMRRVFGQDVGDVPVTALKSMTGHLVGASGPLAAAIAARALSERVITPTPNFVDTDIDVDLNVVAKEPREMPAGPNALMVNAFGFGGQNVSLVLSSARG
ncbi:beta-ketoacyl-[acyl-carrier-protein] synthase family protein [Kineococcus sp. SYSU DK005]|uniref:beta-ketoacyl-[acyl-carrier-protein] synthase family protein n=1 Tax=Kineococcus sp. SYSU DK005 TaxID=3383126 RepID=UPI003D7E53CE